MCGILQKWKVDYVEDSSIFSILLQRIRQFRITYYYSTWIEIVVKRLAFSQKLRREKKIKTFYSAVGIAQIE